MEMPSFFRKYNHKRFNYIPLYYNRQKEELQERMRIIKKEESGEQDADYKKSIIRGSFRHVSAYRAKSERASSLRVVFIILILLGFVLFLFSL